MTRPPVFPTDADGPHQAGETMTDQDGREWTYKNGGTWRSGDDTVEFGQPVPAWVAAMENLDEAVRLMDAAAAQDPDGRE